jgi:hypothetical protein
MNQMKRKARRLAWLIASLCLMAGAANGCALVTGMQDKRDPNAPEAVIWDFSQGNEIRGLDGYALQDMKRRNSEVMSYDDPIHLTLRLPGDRTLDEDLNAVICKLYEPNGDKVENVIVYFPYMTTAEIERTGNRLIEYWKFDRKNFNDWCRVRYGAIPEEDERLSFENRFYSYPHSDKPPSFSLEILHSRDPQKPWLIIWKVSWVSLDAK